MWQKVELTEEGTREEAIEALVSLGGVMAELEITEHERVKATDKIAEIIKPKAKKTKNTIISSDPVNHPSHYTTGGIETIDFIEAKGLDYNLGNVVKYITRADKKGKQLRTSHSDFLQMELSVGCLKQP